MQEFEFISIRSDFGQSINIREVFRESRLSNLNVDQPVQRGKKNYETV
jgi:hypothetical protein